MDEYRLFWNKIIVFIINAFPLSKFILKVLISDEKYPHISPQPQHKLPSSSQHQLKVFIKMSSYQLFKISKEK